MSAVVWTEGWSKATSGGSAVTDCAPQSGVGVCVVCVSVHVAFLDLNVYVMAQTDARSTNQAGREQHSHLVSMRGILTKQQTEVS